MNIFFVTFSTHITNQPPANVWKLISFGDIVDPLLETMDAPHLEAVLYCYWIASPYYVM